MTPPKVGDRVRLTKDFSPSRSFNLKAGTTATLVAVSSMSYTVDIYYDGRQGLKSSWDKAWWEKDADPIDVLIEEVGDGEEV